MTTTLTVEQAVQHLIQSPSRSSNDRGPMTVSEANGGNTLRFYDAPSPNGLLLLPVNDVRNWQRGRRSTGGRVDDEGEIGVIHEAPSQVSDVQRCLKNIIVSQVSIIKKQQQLIAEKDRQIEDLKRENDELRNAVRSTEENLSNVSIAQPCECTESQGAAPSSGADSSGDRVETRESVDLDTRPTSKSRSRRTSDLSVIEVDEDIAGVLRSGRKRGTFESEEHREKVVTPNGLVTLSGRSKKAKRRHEMTEPDVQTPGWRLVQLSAIGTLEGTENITDEAFIKRHQKCEVEERRVIRRDKMRQREAMLKEKKIRGNQKQEQPEAGSADPLQDLSALEAIEICTILHPTRKALRKKSRKRRRYSRK